MKKNIPNVLLLVLSLLIAIMISDEFTGKILYILVYMCGFIGGVSLVFIKLNMKNSKLNMYKRELEKESVNSDENSARVKVLEAKVEVLEKALENALKK